MTDTTDAAMAGVAPMADMVVEVRGAYRTFERADSHCHGATGGRRRIRACRTGCGATTHARATT